MKIYAKTGLIMEYTTHKNMQHILNTSFMWSNTVL